MHFVWYKYSYPEHKYTCLGSAVDCGKFNPHPNNYYICDNCSKRRWFESKIISFKSNDITRAEAQQRLNLKDPLNIHAEVKKQHKEFTKRGGTIALVTQATQTPTILWNEKRTLIRGLQWPAIYPAPKPSTTTQPPFLGSA